jgi:hypothetical protein
MRKTWGKTVGAARKTNSISSLLYPHAFADSLVPVGEYPTYYTAKQWVLPTFTHTKNVFFISVSRLVFHIIHRTYNKPLLNKLLNCY